MTLDLTLEKFKAGLGYKAVPKSLIVYITVSSKNGKSVATKTGPLM